MQWVFGSGKNEPFPFQAETVGKESFGLVSEKSTTVTGPHQS